MSKSGGSCGGPYWPVRQSPTDKSLKFEMEAKKVAINLRAKFSIINELPKHPAWWMKNKVYLRWIEFVSNNKKRKYKITRRPALVVSQNNQFEVFYDWEDLEKKISYFRLKVLTT